MTVNDVKKDLKEIKYYYDHKSMFDRAMETSVKTEVMRKVQLYNKYMSKAEARLFGLYVALYVENNTQQKIATNWGLSEGYIRKLNRQLCEYLLEKNCKKEMFLQSGEDN